MGPETLFNLTPRTLSDFEQYDTDRPEIWTEFKRITLKLVSRGTKHYGAKAIFEIIRYHRIVEYNDAEFKLNNNYTAYYARKFIKLHPEHDGFFETRKARATGILNQEA